MSLRKLIQSLILAVLPLATTVAFAQEERFPSKPIQVIITSTPGSLSDVMARFYGNEMAKTLGQSTVVISKASSSGTIGTEFVKRAPADGYTLLVGGSTTMSANLFLVKNLPYDPLKDFDPVSQVSINPLVLVVRAELPIKSVADLVAYAKARPGQMNYGVANADGVCFGQIWARPGIERTQRSILNIAMLTALNRPNQLRSHLNGALNNGCTVDELREILLQSVVYCGLPAALDAVKIAEEVLRERKLLV